MVKILEAINKIRETLGMDANSFFPALVTVFISLCSLVRGIYGTFKSKWEDNFLQLYKSEEQNFFYLIVLLIETVVFVFSYFSSVMFCMTAVIIIPMIGTYPLFYVLASGLSSVLCFVFIKVFAYAIQIKKRIFDKGRFRWLIYAPMFIYNVWILLGTCFHQWKYLSIIVAILLVIVESFGLWVYRGRYIKYQFSDITIYTKNGDIINCNDISKLRRKKKVVVVENGNTVFHIKYDDISKIEYGGDMVVKLKK